MSRLSNEGLLKSFKEALESTMETYNNRAERVENKVEIVDKKIDSLLNKVDRLSKSVNYDSVQLEYQTIEYKHSCQHKEWLTRKQYAGLRKRCKDLGIRMQCTECAKKEAMKKYADFCNTHSGRLPNKEEAQQILQARREEHQRFLNDRARQYASRKEQIEADFQRKKEEALANR